MKELVRRPTRIVLLSGAFGVYVMMVTVSPRALVADPQVAAGLGVRKKAAGDVIAKYARSCVFSAIQSCWLTLRMN
jgi:predicted MFS family arabinose efflux permease